MPLADAKEILCSARSGGYAVAAFNVNNLEFVQAVVAAAEEEDAPTFVAVTETALAYGGDALARLALDVIRYADVSLVVAAAVKEFAPRGVAVEGELGHVAKGRDRGIFTDPGEAAAFVEATGAGSLAVAVGTSHGAYKFEGEPTIDLPRLEAIAAATPVPLVLHGASAVYEDVVRALEGAGGLLPRARGLSDELLAEAVGRGVAKVNVDTDLRLAFVAATRNYLKKDPSAIDPKKILGGARDAVREMARRKIRACHGTGR